MNTLLIGAVVSTWTQYLLVVLILIMIFVDEEEAVRGVNLVQPFEIQSACGTPNYTNFTAGFRACLDYIFYQTNNLLVKEVCNFRSMFYDFGCHLIELLFILGDPISIR